MEPIYGPNGDVVAWLDSPDAIRALDGGVIGWLYGDAVYTTAGSHVGYFNDGLLRDNNGDVVAWIEGASGGPLKPIRSIRPVQPIRGIAPIRPIREIRNVRAMRSLSWSRMSIGQYLAGR